MAVHVMKGKNMENGIERGHKQECGMRLNGARGKSSDEMTQFQRFEARRKKQQESTN
jgi:hypothetical protein